MRTPTLVVNEHRIPLSPSTDVSGLIDQVTSARNAGGGFIQVQSRDRRNYDLLVNETTQILVCRDREALEPAAPTAPQDPRTAIEV